MKRKILGILLFLCTVLSSALYAQVNLEELSDLKKELSKAKSHINNLEYKIEQLQKETLAIRYQKLRRQKFFSVQMERKFFDYIHNNPIDKALKSFEPFEGHLSTAGVINVIRYRFEAWDAEMKNSIIKLKDFLTKDDYKKLLEGQKAWESYMKSSSSIDIALIYSPTKYIPQGSMYRHMVMRVQFEKTRARAIELLAYIYIFTKKVNFVFTEK